MSDSLWPHGLQLSCVWLFVTSWTAACQASLSLTISQSPGILGILGICLELRTTHLCNPILRLFSYSKLLIWNWKQFKSHIFFQTTFSYLTQFWKLLKLQWSQWISWFPYCWKFQKWLLLTDKSPSDQCYPCPADHGKSSRVSVGSSGKST